MRRGARVSFRRPFTSNSVFASILPPGRAGWGAPKLTLSPGAGNPRYATERKGANREIELPRNFRAAFFIFKEM